MLLHGTAPWRICITLFCTFQLICAAAATHIDIDECPGKEVTELRQKASRSELSLIFYHVAWCNASKEALQVFEEFALLHREQVYFATVDCYHLSCNCSRTHPLAPGLGIPNEWPTLMVYYGYRIPLQYDGEWSLPALTRFLNKLYEPVVRLHGKEELRRLSMTSSAVVLGLFETVRSRAYGHFVSAAVKWLHYDPEGSYRYAVAVGSAAKVVLESDHELPLILILSNRGVEMFSTTKRWNASQIITWVRVELRRHHVNNLVSDIGTPKQVLNQVRTGGPTLVIFGNGQFYEHMRTVIHPVSVLLTKTERCPFALFNDEWREQNERAHVQRDMETKKREQPTICHSWQFLRSPSWHWQYYYSWNAALNEFLCRICPPCLTATNDPHSSTQLLRLHQRNKCLQYTPKPTPALKWAITKHLQRFVDSEWPGAQSHFNRSLRVVLLDSDEHRDYLNAQRIQLTTKDATTVLIIDPHMESTFVMSDRGFTHDALWHFVHDYYGRNLITAYRACSEYQSSIKPSPFDAVELYQANKNVLLNTVNQPNVTTVALLYSPECAFSSLMSQTLLQVMASFDASVAGIRIMRLNTQTDELPWELIMPRTPTLIVFPRGRTAESRVFPAHLKVTTRNIFGFILAQLEPIDQLKVVFSRCGRLEEQPPHFRKCIQFAKTLATKHIASHLRMWQIYKDERSALLMRLKEFKAITLDMKRSLHF